MRRYGLSAFLGLVLALWALGDAQADAPFTTIQPGMRADYRFDYTGDGSEIRMALDASDASGLTLSVYTPEQYQALQRGELVNPVGRGTAGRDHDLYWAGSFKSRGVYHAIVESRASTPVLYRLAITGQSVGGAAQIVTVNAPTASTLIDEKGKKLLAVSLPPGMAVSTLYLTMPAVPSACTPARQLPPVIGQSIKLCPHETYPPLRVVGDNIGVFVDDARTARVTSEGRQFAITMEGSNNWIEGITIQAKADPQDLGAWLCLYDECVFPTRPMTTTVRGGIRYGGGILVRGSNSTVHGVTVRGGSIGVATVEGQSNYIVDNQLSELNAWGSFNLSSIGSYFVGNVLSRNNHGCTTPDGRKFQTGCETSGLVCLGCQQNVLALNHCELSANCFYLSGERGLANNDNQFVANYCAGASDNCFEITFSQRNLLQDNVGTVDHKTDTPCKYPFWVGGSIVYFQNNRWECAINPEDAFNQSRDSTIVATNIINLDVPGLPPAVAALTVTPPPLATRVKLGWAFVSQGPSSAR